MTSRRARLVLVVIVLGVVGVGVVVWEPLWWLMIKTSLDDNEAVRGTPDHRRELTGNPVDRIEHKTRRVLRTHRWTGENHGWEQCWFVETGRLHHEALYVRGELKRETEWSYSGVVCRQRFRTLGGRLIMTDRNPWRWNVTGQTAPSSPRG